MISPLQSRRSMLNILFIQEPSVNSTEYHKLTKDDRFNVIKYILATDGSITKESFIEFLMQCNRDGVQINGIFAGFPAFHPIGGLTQDIIELPIFHENVKCIALCSRGINFVDLETLTKYNIELFHYDDSSSDSNIAINQVGNDVADCAMWHVLEGFRKFSLFMNETITTKHSIKSRQVIRDDGTTKFAFGHELNANQFVLSPRGQRALILGMGSIGCLIATKLQYGLGMEIHYSKRGGPIKNDSWKYHPMDNLHEELYQFDAIVIALPGTTETFHLVDTTFLSKYKNDNLILVNVGRASIFDMEAITQGLSKGQIRHLGMDVFTNEPLIDSCLLDSRNKNKVTYTPHIGSGTKQVFDQSTDLAITQLTRWLLPSDTSSSRSH